MTLTLGVKSNSFYISWA